MKLFGAGKPDHPMADRKEATRVLGELPAQDHKALEELSHWYESLSSAEGFKPDERAQRFAMLDEAAQPRLRKVAKDYLASVRSAKGSRAQENLVWTRVHEYWRQAGQGFARAIDEKKPVPGMVLGALRALAQQLKWQQLRYGPIDPALWGQMNRTYLLAETRGIAESRTEYLKAAMFSSASPDTRPAAELELAERIIGELAGAFTISNAPSKPCATVSLDCTLWRLCLRSGAAGAQYIERWRSTPSTVSASSSGCGLSSAGTSRLASSRSLRFCSVPSALPAPK